MGTFASNVGLAVSNLAAQRKVAVHRLRAAHRQDRVGERQPLHVPPAALDLHADRDADSRGGEAEEEALGDRLSELRVRPVGDRVVQEAAESGAAGRASSSPSRRRRSARSTPARWCRRWPTRSRTRSSRRCSPPTCRSSCARATRAACSRTRRCSTCSRGEPEYLDTLKDETPDGWWVTGYPWSEINTPEHQKFLDAYQKRWKDYPRQGSVVGYASVYTAANAHAQGGQRRTPRSWSRR